MKGTAFAFYFNYNASEHLQSLSEHRKPQRIIVIKFPSRKELEDCFSSKEYKAIMGKRIRTVDARAVIAEEI